MARDPDTIERDIERARDALADSLDELSERASPKRLVEHGKQGLSAVLADPRVRYALIGLGVLVGAVVVRRLLR